MEKIAIKNTKCPNPELIEYFISQGGKNVAHLTGTHLSSYYYINDNNKITCDYYFPKGYIEKTLEQLKSKKMTKKEIESYKDFKKGDVVVKDDEKRTIIENINDVCFCARYINTKDEDLTTWSRNELYNVGYRLYVEEEEEIEDDVVELTLDEIAKLKGIDVSRLRIKE